jgi:hypothetical protein
MTVKIVILKSGENVISDIKEGYTGDELIAYILDNPCTIVSNGKYRITDDLGESKEQMSISLHRWPNFSADSSVAIPVDYFVAAVDPIPGLKKMYENQFNNDKNSSVDEQSDVTLSD